MYDDDDDDDDSVNVAGVTSAAKEMPWPCPSYFMLDLPFSQIQILHTLVELIVELILQMQLKSTSALLASTTAKSCRHVCT